MDFFILDLFITTQNRTKVCITYGYSVPGMLQERYTNVASACSTMLAATVIAVRALP